MATGRAEPSSDGSRAILHRSASTEHFLAAPRPRLRGVSHLIAATLTIPVAIIWTVLASPATTRLAVASFAGGVSLMFLASATLHRRKWSAATYERLLRADHTGIYCAIVGTGVAVGILGFEGWPAVVMLAAALVGGALGVVAEWMPFAPPRGFSNTVYLTLGWTPVILLPWLWQSAGASTVALLLAGGVVYTVGAIVVGARRPDPNPWWFGYHEIFHLMVIIAVVLHGIMIWRLM
ncbi:MAG: hemolysin III family protein [Nitriliruptoraceae bacterium]